MRKILRFGSLAFPPPATHSKMVIITSPPHLWKVSCARFNSSLGNDKLPDIGELVVAFQQSREAEMGGGGVGGPDNIQMPQRNIPTNPPEGDPADSFAEHLYNVPATSPNGVVTGREHDVRIVMQNVLQGKNLIVLTGPEGVGKTTLAAALADHAKRSAKFTCVRWFRANSCLEAQCMTFLEAAKGRKERDVLLVFDGVKDYDAVSKFIPKQPPFFTIVTYDGEGTPKNLENSFTLKYPVQGLFDAESIRILTGSANLDVKSAERLKFNPLLLRVVGGAIRCGAVPEEVIRIAETDGLRGVIAHLRDIAGKTVYTQELLACMACLNNERVPLPFVLNALGCEADDALRVIQEMGLIVDLCDASECVYMHPGVHRELRQALAGSMGPVLSRVAKALSESWPRRLRHVSTEVGIDLASHTNAFCKSLGDTHGLTPEGLAALDKCSQYLYGTLGMEPSVSAEMIEKCLQSSVISPHQSAVMALSLGRLYLMQQQDDKACDAFMRSRRHYLELEGENSLDAAIALGHAATFLPPTKETLGMLGKASAILSGAYSTKASSPEEKGYYGELWLGVATAVARCHDANGDTEKASKAWEHVETIFNMCTNGGTDESQVKETEKADEK